MGLNRRQLGFVLLSILVLPVWRSNFLSAAAPVAARSSTKKAQSIPKKKIAKKSTTKKRKRSSPRLRRMHQAFVASSSLKPMARQLLQDRTPAAYAGVESYARSHTKEDAGALAWLVVGYAHILDHDYSKAIDPLNRAKPNAGDLGDYVNFYLGSSYLQTGQTAEAIATLGEFDKTYPDSLLIRDAHVLYANALLAAGRGREAIPVLEKDREPTRAEVELALGRAYAASGEPEKAANILRNLYFTMPLGPEAIQADEELKKLATSSPLPPPGLNLRRTRADLLAKGKRFSEAADAYRDLVDQVSPSDRTEVQLTMWRCAGLDRTKKLRKFWMRSPVLHRR